MCGIEIAVIVAVAVERSYEEEVLSKPYESGSANGMKEMSMTRKRVPRGMRRLMPFDVRSVRLRSIRLAAHPHLEHFLHAIVHPRRVVAPLLRPGNKQRTPT